MELTTKSKDNKSYSINIYDKLSERLNEQDRQEKKLGYSTITDTELDIVSDLLRVEIQCEQPKLKSIKDKYNLNTIMFRADTDYLKEDTAKQLIQDTLKLRLGTADFYKLDYLKDEVLPDLFRREKTQKQVYNLLKWISQKGHTAEQAKKDYKALSKDTICRYYRTLREAGVEPVTLPARTNTYRLSGLSHLYTLTELEQDLS